MGKRYFVIMAVSALLIAAVIGAGRTGLAQDGDNIYFSGEIVGPDVVVTDAPYTANGVRENTQTLADGNRIVHTATQFVARDSKGRIRREETISNIGPIEVKGPKIILITDPVLKRQILLDTQKRVATISGRRFYTLPLEIRKAVKPEDEKSAKPSKDSEEKAPQQQRRPAGDLKDESLGTKVMEGLNVRGELNKWTIPVGRIGNKEPINVSVESWWSPDLQVEVMRHRIDPRFGDVKYTLTKIERKEPDASLFQIPKGYKVITKP